MNHFDLLKKHLLQISSRAIRVYNLKGSSSAFFLAVINEPFIAVEKDEASAWRLKKDIEFFRRLFGIRERLVFLPDRNGPETSGIRAQIIFSEEESDSIVTSSESLNGGLWDKYILRQNIITVQNGLQINRESLEDLLIRMGYKRLSMVASPGEYSWKGWIVDIFPSTSEHPLRLEFFGDEIDQIRYFDVDTQRSMDSVQSFDLMPACEPDHPKRLFEIFPGKKCFCLYPEEDNVRLPDGTIFLSRYSFQADNSTDNFLIKDIDAEMLAIQGTGILPDERGSLDMLPEKIKSLNDEGIRTVIIASSRGQADRLKDLFRDKDIPVPVIDLENLYEYKGNVSITIGNLSSGLFFNKLLILTEREIFGERTTYRPIKKSKITNLLISIDDIRTGDFVVHKEHGIGRFSGTVRQKVDETEMELLQIEYDGGRLYLPVQNIQYISKYRAEEGIIPKLDRLGGKTWIKKKARARKRINEIAEKLLSLYADRRRLKGISYSQDTELHREFDSFFQYEETPDQLDAIRDIKKDMESDVPMDRLLCGDVGYGKTEVAMRAAFKAVYDNFQVAVLVPTTILAEQHYRTFKERFSGFPVNIDYISRFKTRQQINDTRKAIVEGRIDIIIGTHALLSQKIRFNRLGLLIIDEEHKFGVSQKEKIKDLSRNVDVLSLTATPIPRTLHMSLSGIRDMSIIETPPEERLAVKTTVTAFNDNVIRDAIRNEINRNGQVFFVHNRIKDIKKMNDYLAMLVPEAKIAVAHGQMPEKELEEIMHMFFKGEIDILVSTAIIGSGLDIPRANTIIINRADQMGLADLYQLRGRVGRSDIKGYAFFLIPDEKLMTEESRKRIQAIQDMSYLGAGFRLAMKDLEIRGAGNIFGPEQSGNINEIGFDLYMEMLEKAVAELKGTEIPEETETTVDLRLSAYIPEDYIEDITLRINFYRRISSMKTEKEIQEFISEMEDRFGDIPEEVRNLLEVMRLKIAVKGLSVTKIKQYDGKVRVFFSPDTVVQPWQIFDLHKVRTEKIRFMPDGFEFDVNGQTGRMVVESICEMVSELKKSL